MKPMPAMPQLESKRSGVVVTRAQLDRQGQTCGCEDCVRKSLECHPSQGVVVSYAREGVLDVWCFTCGLWVASFALASGPAVLS